MPTANTRPTPRFPKRPLLLLLRLACGALLAIAAGPAAAQSFPAPTDISSTLMTGPNLTQVQLSWSQAPDLLFGTPPADFVIQVRRSVDSFSGSAAHGPANAPDFLVTKFGATPKATLNNLPLAGTFVLRIKAKFTSPFIGTSDWSDEHTITTPPTGKPAITSVESSPRGETVTLNWTAATGAATYIMHAYEAGGAAPADAYAKKSKLPAGAAFADAAGLTGASTAQMITGLARGQTYRFVMRALDADSNAGPFSDAEELMIPAVGGDATLRAFEVLLSNESAPRALTPEFHADTGSYALRVSFAGAAGALSQASISATATDANALVSITPGNPDGARGTANATVALVVGETEAVTTVTADDEMTAKTYTLSIARAPNITGLALAHTGGGGAIADFTGATTSYAAGGVANSVSAAAVTPTFGAGVSVTVGLRGGTATAVASSGATSDPLTLAVGENVIEVAVTQDGYTMTYIITLVRAAPTVTTPGKPGNLRATAGKRMLALAWDAPADTGGAVVTAYKVRYATTQKTSEYLNTDGADGEDADDPAARSHTITGLTSGQEYRLEVAAVNSEGRGAWSDAVRVTVKSTPDAPTGLSATPGHASLSLAWTAPADNGGSVILKYRYRWSDDPGNDIWESRAPGDSGDGADGIVIPNSAGLGAYLLTGLANGATYEVQVAADNLLGAGEWSGGITATPAPLLPAAPVITDIVPGRRDVTIHWDAVADRLNAPVSGYQARLRILAPAPGGGFTPQNWEDPVEVGASPRSYTFDKLNTQFPYDFQVAAVNASGRGDWSAAMRETPGLPPGAPALAALDAGYQSLRLSWTAPADDGGAVILGYLYRWSNDDDDAWENANRGGGELIPSSAESTMYTIDGLVNGTTYTVQIAARNARGVGAWSASQTEIPSETGVTAPTAPLDFRVFSRNQSLLLNWNAPASDGGANITRYRYRWSNDSDDDWENTGMAAGVVISDSAATAFTIPSLTNGTAYTVQIAAENVAGTGTWTLSQSATPSEATAPGPPTDVGARPADGTLTLVWSPPDNDGGMGITGYEVRLRVAAGGGIGAGQWSSPVTAAGGGAARLHAFTGLINGTLYDLQVRAVNTVGEGGWAGIQGHLSTAPKAPVNLRVVGGDRSLVMDWDLPPNADNDAAITAFFHRWRRANAGDDSAWDNPGGADGDEFADETYTIVGLENGSTYAVQVAARNRNGVGAWSDTQQGVPDPVTRPDAPAGLSVITADSSLILGWDEPANTGGENVDITSYQVRWRTAGTSGGGATVEPGEWSEIDVADGAARSQPITGLTNGVLYDMQVAAFNHRGRGAWSEVATDAPATVPAAPADFRVLPGNRGLVLAWSAPVADGRDAVTDYLARWSEEGEDWLNVGAANGEVLPGRAATTRTLFRLDNGTEYTVQIAALNRQGRSDWSAPANGAPTMLDVDGVAGVSSRDALLAVRYLAGLRGEALVANLPAENSASHAEIAAALARAAADSNMPLDINGDGALTLADGILFARYMLGVRGAGLVKGQAAEDADAVMMLEEALKKLAPAAP